MIGMGNGIIQLSHKKTIKRKYYFSTIPYYARNYTRAESDKDQEAA